ncbi:uncharacterized protein LOC131663044 [Phymastichus coffea]|uniref:uncharacterized protein LOC131663044 n=1 Tax=Phymastichus coffea TaxID=108790 RepID=UPI00273B89C4|nr:uncharacterized protein LOC131663044 [Phymastichus coffea]
MEIKKAFSYGLKYNSNQQILMLRKLIISSLINGHHLGLRQYMNSNKSLLPLNVKKNLLDALYGKVNKHLITLLDLNKQYRFLIIENVKYFEKVLRQHNKNIHKIVQGSCSFEDTEGLFYEVIEEIEGNTKYNNDMEIR